MIMALRNLRSTRIILNFGEEVLERFQFSACNSQTAGLKYFAPPKKMDDIQWPESNKLKMVEKQPVLQPGQKYRRMQKNLKLMRGPELVNNFLIYQQYGLQAVTGGRMKYENFEFLRRAFLKGMPYDRMFALWRIDPPWQAVSKKGSGKKMGGGKGPIHHYVTPVKAGRIILEVGGNVDPVEMQVKLAPLASNLPFPARYVTHEMLQKEEKDKKWREENNLNPYTMKYVILNNLGGCNNWLSPYDYLWFGEHR